ncbi:MAG: hypothetical protein HDR10_10135, partial [Lachnospiraceae bacterium]|nr:hypothetical protein [Lachnospiraceae bacterium]
NFNTYKDFIKEVHDADISPGQYGLLGRHDVSLTNDACDLKWLIYMQYLLNKYTTHQQNEDYGKLFSTYETFVKVEMDDTLTDTEGSEKDIYYDRVNTNLDNLCNEFSKKLAEKKQYYNGEYQIPIRAVKHSVLSILKNRFAEDFVLCMYSSFCEMLLYLIEKMSLDKDDPEAFEACYGEYFRGLNSLVNSAMHSERQFIQATAFNALIYDVPSKIMAFYVAVIHDIQSIIKSNQDKNYTFLLTPSFSNEIYVKMISYQNEELPHDRILMVSINEKSLYNPKGVSRRMAHEVAHYVGDEIRDRQCRKECLELSVIYIILNEIFHSVFIETESFYPLIEKIREALINDEMFNLARMNYSEDLTRVGAQIVEEFIANQEILRLLDEHVFKTMENMAAENDSRKIRLTDYISQIIQLQAGGLTNILGEVLKEKTWSQTEIEIIKNLVMDDIKEKINHINRDSRYLLYLGEMEQSVALGKTDDILKRKTIGEFANMLKSIYSEAFADVQMILLLNFGYEDYLNGFLVDESINLKKLPKSMEDLSRISMVVLTMNLIGMWDELGQQDCWNGKEFELHELHQIIRRECAAMIQGIEWEDEENLEKLKKAVQCFRNQVGDQAEIRNREYADYVIAVEDENVDDRMVNVYINNQLLQYLIGCVGRSIAQYLNNEDKIERIKKLRKTIKTVIDCENMRETFKAVCLEVKEYKETIF